jgi:rhodanese-related sulfurtransferase
VNLTLSSATVANTSQHLQRLKQAGLIEGRREGQFVFYRVAGDDVVRMLSAVSRVGQARVAEIERIVKLYFAAKDELEPVTSRELVDRARKGLVTVLDVRPHHEFAAGHVPGAVNIPVEELSRRLRELPKGKEVVAYCGGPFCLMSFDAIHLLRKKGFKARRLQDGMPEWRASGLAVSSGA